MVRFSKGVKRRKKLGVANILQVPTSNCIGPYVGCRNIDCKRMIRDFMVIKEKFNFKLANWKTRILSQAVKSVIIKTNVESIPLFTTQGIGIPNYITKEIDSANNIFFFFRTI